MLQSYPLAAFSHVWAGFYAGLGTIGWNQTLITRAYGPRHRLASVFTEAKIEPDEMIADPLCNRCRICEKVCPEGVFSEDQAGSLSAKAISRPSQDRSSMDKIKCAKQRFGQNYQHCGFCIKSCPMGNDRRLFKGSSAKQYALAHEDRLQWKMGLFPNTGR
jgi:epoxyqueuosine reductase QueG